MLLVSRGEKSNAFFTEMLEAVSVNQIVTLPTCGEARRLLLEREFDMVIINAPLADESGESLARHIAGKGSCQVILVVKSEYYEEVSAVTEEDGVLTVAKPVNRAILWSALKLAKAAQARLRQVRSENSRLQQRLEDIRVVNRAKYLLISHLSMSEEEAHRYIEKQAMDLRATRRAVAEGILKTYEN